MNKEYEVLSPQEIIESWKTPEEPKEQGLGFYRLTKEIENGLYDKWTTYSLVDPKNIVLASYTNDEENFDWTSLAQASIEELNTLRDIILRLTKPTEKVKYELDYYTQSKLGKPAVYCTLRRSNGTFLADFEDTGDSRLWYQALEKLIKEVNN